MSKQHSSDTNTVKENKVVEPTKLPDPLVFQLTENEILKFKNVGLQRQLLEKESDNLLLQETMLVKMVEQRVKHNLDHWKFDLQQGVVINQETQPKS